MNSTMSPKRPPKTEDVETSENILNNLHGPNNTDLKLCTISVADLWEGRPVDRYPLEMSNLLINIKCTNN